MSTPQFAGRLARAFVTSKLTPLILIASVAMGAAAVLLLPREEEPQIVVPMIDIFVAFPGASAAEVESRVTQPMERLLWEIPGVEYIYSTSSPGGCMTVVRFYVGEDEEKSIVRLNQKMFANFDLIPPGASQPLIKPRSIDDVPFSALTLWSSELDGFQIRRAAAELRNEIQKIPDISSTTLIGGQRREFRVELDPEKIAAYVIPLSQFFLAGCLRRHTLGSPAIPQGIGGPPWRERSRRPWHAALPQVHVHASGPRQKSVGISRARCRHASRGHEPCLSASRRGQDAPVRQ